ncbi:MAG: DnaJ domain-containing protein [Crocinitomicaceae bacterium]|nr:DnaJ domain-containing protein [Crocinitomicaceae bacterium]
MEDDLLIHLIDSIMSTQQYSRYEASKADKTWEIIIGFAIPIIAFVGYIWYKNWKIRIWRKGTFPADLTFTTAHLMEAYSCLTVYLITIDRYHQMQKIAYLRSFFIRQFKGSPDHFDDIIDRNFHYPIEPVSVVNWVNQHAREQQKKQLVQFLVGLCHIDKLLKPKEYTALKVFTKNLQLEAAFLEECILFYQKERATHANNQEQQRTASGSTGVSQRKKYADILGVNESADEKEIKQRYRQLVKRYHPDKYVNESKEQQKQVNQRFLEIQEAYEFLLSGK